MFISRDTPLRQRSFESWPCLMALWLPPVSSPNLEPKGPLKPCQDQDKCASDRCIGWLYGEIRFPTTFQGLLWKPYSGKNHWAKSQECTVWQCCELDDFKASSVVIWGTAVPHVDPLTVVSDDVESLAILGWNRPCCPTTILFMTIPTCGPYFRAARLIGDYGGWFRLGKSTSAAIPFTDFFGTSWIKFDVP